MKGVHTILLGIAWNLLLIIFLAGAATASGRNNQFPYAVTIVTVIWATSGFTMMLVGLVLIWINNE